MPYCPECESETREDKPFCPQCGTRLIAGLSPILVKPAPLSPPAPAKKRRFQRWYIPAGLIVLAVCAALIGTRGRGDEDAIQVAEATPMKAAEPTESPRPTHTPRPTNTPRPTDTPVPTHTPEPTLGPIGFSGSGDRVVEVNKPAGPMIVHITGNTASHYFSVLSYDAAWKPVEPLVNTTDPYDGIRLVDFREGEHTALLEITAMGLWTVEFLPLAEMHILQAPGTFAGVGDDVLRLLGGNLTTATITGNAGGRHFSVTGYDTQVNLLVDTTAPYEGTVLLKGSLILEIQAVGEWSVTIGE